MCSKDGVGLSAVSAACCRDVVGLHASLDPVLDTPTKCTLWKFILVSMQPQHHDYVLHRVGLPTHVLTG